MNDRLELERLKERQARLEQDLALLAAQIKVFEQWLNAPKPTVEGLSPTRPEPAQGPEPGAAILQPAAPLPTTLSQPVPKPIPVAPAQIPPVLFPQASVPSVSQTAKAPGAQAPPPLVGSTAGTAMAAEIAKSASGAKASAVPASAPPRVEPAGGGGQTTPGDARRMTVPPSAKPRDSFEMRLGTYWLVRVGIVMVLTGLVFFGHLAYQNYVRQLGPGGKVCLLYLASALLLGAGWWWQREAAKAALKNYGQVLFAGGLAALYFTTYAAHHVEQLLVIPDARLDGLLLLGCAGFMVWIADRKKSEVLALFAVGLAYYTSIITRVGFFTLYSNLVLTLAAVLFLVRNRWAVLSFGSLVASYAAYGFWRFLDASGWHWAPEDGIWSGTYFLMSYWSVFTAGVFLCRDEKFAGQNRSSFLTLNNGAFFIMFLLTMMQVHHGAFWQFALGYGGVLLGLAALARRALPIEPLAKNSYLTQGLLLVTVGLISKFSGLQLALILAMESVVLLLTGHQRNNLVLVTGGYIAAGMSVGWGIDGMRQMEPSGVYLAVGLGGLMLLNAIIVHRRTAPAPIPLPRPAPAYFTVLALIVWLVATWDNAAREHFPLIASAEGALIMVSIYLFRVPEFAWLGLGYAVLAQSVWVYDVFAGETSWPWWDPLSMVALAIAICQWWQNQSWLEPRQEPGLDGWRKVAALAKNIVLLASVQVAVRFAGGWTLQPINPSTSLSFYLPLALGVLLFADTLLAHYQGGNDMLTLRPQPAYSAALALVVWLAVTWHHTVRPDFPLVLGAQALLLTFSFYLVRVREITLLGQGYLLLAQLLWVCDALNADGGASGWKPLLLLVMTVGISHWWQRQRVLEIRSEIRLGCQAVYALATVCVLYFWLNSKVHAPAWLVLTSLLAVGMTAYGIWTRAWFIAAFGQVFVLVSGVQFFWQLAEAKPDWQFPLAPVAVLALLSGATAQWFRQRPHANPQVREPLLGLATFYRWAALLMGILWVCTYIPTRERVWFLAVLATLAFAWGGWRRNQESLLFSAAFTCTALVLFWQSWLEPEFVYLPDLAAILLLLVQQQVAQRLAERYHLDRAIHGAAIIVGSASLWLFLSRWVLRMEEATGGSYLTASWSVLGLALFTAGFVLRERFYRWLGLAALACALGRVVVFDVWKLETIYRVLSFMALGIVLLVLAFIYTKYQEKIKEWM